MGMGASRGQATVEWVGTVVVIAAMTAIVALWVARELSPPDRAPDPVAVVAAPLSGVGRELGGGGIDLPALAAGDPRADLGARAAGWIGRTSRSAFALGRDMGAAFGVNFGARLGHRVRRVLDDPPTGADLLPDPASLTPGAIVRDLARYVGRDPRALIDYVRALRGMPPREAAVLAAGDAGTLAADGAVEAAELLIKRLILRGMARTGRGGSTSRSP